MLSWTKGPPQLHNQIQADALRKYRRTECIGDDCSLAKSFDVWQFKVTATLWNHLQIEKGAAQKT